MLDSDSPTAKKSMLREAMLVHRAKAHAFHSDAALALKDYFIHHIKLPPHAVVAGYHARASEMDPSLLLEALHQRGHTLALPVVIGKAKPLQFRLYCPGDPLLQGAMEILEPLTTRKIIEPDIMIVPLLAFDSHGNRLGYGGGFYDRTLKLLRKKKAILAIGVGYSCQEVTCVPTTPYDVKLDQIITEQGPINLQD